MSLTNEQRKRITDVAISWTGTPYRGWSCLKGAGCDCGQLLKGVFVEAGFVRDISLPTDYSLQAQQHKVDPTYRLIVERYMREISEAEVKRGDVVLYKLRGFHEYGHGAIVIRWPDYVIHATARHGVCGAHGSKEPMFRSAEKKFYTVRDEFAK
jgi:hypothetical protein